MLRSTSRLRQFTISKAGNAEDENEDRYGEPRHTQPGGEKMVLALSDGATEASFSREWAEILVRSRWSGLFAPWSRDQGAFLNEERVADWLSTARDEFVRMSANRKLAWYAQAKAQQGAFATFLAVRLTHGGGFRRWSAVACGDTCVFQVRAGRIVTVFPLENPDDFGNRPFLVPSNSALGCPPVQLRRDGTWQTGDTFVLATDALAAWLLDVSDGECRLRDLLSSQDDASFRAVIERERVDGRMKNDDTTALIYET